MNISIPDDICNWQTLGDTGLKISQIIVGCMSFGSNSWSDWVESDEEKVFEILKKCYDSGIRTFDTADMYSNGYSEVLLGKFLKKYKIKRDKVIIMTKCFNPIDEDLPIAHGNVPNTIDLQNSWGLSRKHIFDAIEGSLRRLDLEYVDLLQIHRLDPTTSYEEICKALNDVVEKGYTRYIGASSMRATEFADLQFTCEKKGYHKFVSMQDYYNLLYREEEREMHPFARRHNVGLIPWSPQARGILTRPLNAKTKRMVTDPTFKGLGLDIISDADEEIINRVEEIAKKRDVSMSIIAVSWVISKGCCPILGLSSEERVEEAVQATKFKLTPEEIKFLEEPYKPKAVVGFRQ